MVKIYTRYDVPPSEGIVFVEPSLTQQHFADSCDINYILAQYDRTGVYGDPSNSNPTVQPMAGDFSSMEDFHTAQTILARSKEMFDALPSAVRKRFDNDPAQLLYFLEDENNRKEAEDLGFIQKAIVVDGSTGGPVVPPEST